MVLSDLQNMTVIQLRKLAREQHVVLGAGLDKNAIVQKIASSLSLFEEPVQQSFLEQMDDISVPVPQKEEEGSQDRSEPECPAEVQPAAQEASTQENESAGQE